MIYGGNQMDFEKFYGKIWKAGDSFVITIPSNFVKFAGFVEGDEVVIMIKKQIKKEE